MTRRSRKSSTESLYSVHPGVAMVQKWIAELPAKTGRTIDQWTDFVKQSGPPTEKERREWLKKEHGLGTNTAWWIAERAEGGPQGIAEEDPETYLKAAAGYVEAMFAGPRAALRPVYDALLEKGLSLASDVKACPCKTIVPLYRNHVFAEIKPATRTRIDMGFALGAMKPTGRLLDTGGFAKKNRITHRIPILTLADIDGEVDRWLKTAYDLDA
jgi:hypothetical protein